MKAKLPNLTPQQKAEILGDTSAFWSRYHALPPEARQLADKAYRLWRDNHWHPSLHFKKVGGYWVARISEDYRAIGIESGGTVAWFWIGPHDEHERLLSR